ncbi:hypothetical protein JXL21_00980 [Candidatus Bathyarchaeota archaeon]|nr:hypothetical protein [Candidatus Bathyarchaeota archaeon]
MSINIPDDLRKFLVLTEQGDMIDRFKCPVCSFRTRLGPGALRMHLLLKSDPKVESQYDAAHGEYMKTLDFNMDMVRELASIPMMELRD